MQFYSPEKYEFNCVHSSTTVQLQSLQVAAGGRTDKEDKRSS